jgi:hypothetical protein
MRAALYKKWKRRAVGHRRIKEVKLSILEN